MLEWNLSKEDRDSDRPWVGWLCTYTPEEIIYASGFHPFRLREDRPSTKMADTYLHYNLCPYVRSCLDIGLRGEIPQMKGIILLSSCDAMRSLYHVWRHYLSPSSFVHFMNIPKITGTRAVEFFKKEIQKLVDVLAEYRGSEIKDSNLVEAVGIYNESRSLMSELYELRKEANLGLTGALVYKIVQSSQSMPKKAFNRKLKEFLSDAKKRAEQPSQSIGPRIMIVGSLLPDLQIVQIIEDAGALIVSDDLCFGNRYFDGNIEKGDDLLEAISQRYLNKAPCARMKETGLRLERVKSQIEEFKVDGIIYLSLKFCDNHLYDYPVYREYFREIRVLVLQIEEDFTGGNIGQIRTRIEAFIEML